QYDVGLRACGVGPFSQAETCDIGPQPSPAHPDLMSDGQCDIGDALLMAQCDVGLIDCQFICKPFTCPSQGTSTTTTQTTTTTSTTRLISTSSTTVASTSTTSTTSTTFIPPDPKTVAPTVNPTQFTELSTSTSFLYAGSSPIQVGVAPGTIVQMRAAVLRGKVTQRDGTPLSGVRISIVGHPELGLTYTRTD